MRLDEEKLEELRSWGERLGESGSEEHAAIGRAILMLIEEIDRLNIDLWHGRIGASAGPTVEADIGGAERVASSLHGRLRRALRRGEAGKLAERPGSDTASDTSAQAWIDSLRRQR